MLLIQPLRRTTPAIYVQDIQQPFDLHAFERDYQKGRTASDIEVTITISDEA
jgi:hypothetical protein